MREREISIEVSTRAFRQRWDGSYDTATAANLAASQLGLKAYSIWQLVEIHVKDYVTEKGENKIMTSRLQGYIDGLHGEAQKYYTGRKGNDYNKGYATGLKRSTYLYCYKVYCAYTDSTPVPY